jgi:hypothetical protein
MKESRELLKAAIKTIPEDDIYSYWAKGLLQHLEDEEEFWEEVQSAGKSIIDTLYTYRGQLEYNPLLALAITYDRHHPIRFKVETMDSVESIRIKRKNK